MDKTDKQHDGH